MSVTETELEFLQRVKEKNNFFVSWRNAYKELMKDIDDRIELLTNEEEG